MLKQLVALLHLSLSDLVTSGEFATALTTVYHTFLMPQRSYHLLTKLTSGIFCAIPPLMMVPNSFQIFHLLLNRDLALKRSPPKWFLVPSTILMHPATTGPYRIPAIVRCVLQSIPLFLLNYTINACFPSCWKSLSVVPDF